jgi:prepilin-type N-terminal cleavage/methylation domain-containing protein
VKWSFLKGMAFPKHFANFGTRGNEDFQGHGFTWLEFLLVLAILALAASRLGGCTFATSFTPWMRRSGAPWE